MILAAVLLKLGTYGFVRIAIPILPEAARSWAPWIGLLAVIGIIYGALGCLAQTDMKRLIAFSSVAHMGFVMLGIATLTDFGINAAIFGMVAHGLITGMLFFIAGSVKERYHTLEIQPARRPARAGAAPGLDPRLLRHGVARPARPGRVLGRVPGHPRRLPAGRRPARGQLFRVFMVVAAIGTVFAAGYLLWLLQRAAFGTPKEEFEDHHFHDVETPEWIAWTPLLVLHRRPRRLPELRLPRRPTASVQTRARPVGWLGALSPLAFDAPARRLPRPRARDRPGGHVRRASLLVDLIVGAQPGRRLGTIAGLGLLAAHGPGPHPGRRRRPTASMFGGAYVVDNFALVLKALFLVAGYVVVLLSTNYIAEGDYWEGEYYLLLLAVDRSA